MPFFAFIISPFLLLPLSSPPIIFTRARALAWLTLFHAARFGFRFFATLSFATLIFSRRLFSAVYMMACCCLLFFIDDFHADVHENTCRQI